MTVPEGFEDVPVVTDATLPSALAFTPDGRLLITTLTGQLRVHEEGTPGTTEALDLSAKTCSNSERGLLGLAVDPNFDAQAPGDDYVYLYYTFKKHALATNPCPTGQPSNPDNPVNRVSRFTMMDDTVDPASEVVLIDNIPSPNGNHNAGDLHALLGKILRIEPDGGIPPGNPYTGRGTDRCNIEGSTEAGKACREIFARGASGTPSAWPLIPTRRARASGSTTSADRSGKR